MAFNGHEIINIMNNSWMLDLTECKIYKVNRTRLGRVTGIEYAGRFILGDDGICIEKEIEMPFAVSRLSLECISRRIEQLRSVEYAV